MYNSKAYENPKNNNNGNASGSGSGSNNDSVAIGGLIDTEKADDSVWLLKCSSVVSRSFQACRDQTRPVAKLVVSIDPLEPDDDNSSRQGKKIAVKGKITVKFGMKPRLDNYESYGNLVRERTRKYLAQKRQIKIIKNDDGPLMRPQLGKEKKKQVINASDTKRTRIDHGEMVKLMFKLFERQPNWTLGQLIEETNQPEPFLKEMLKELCIFIREGATYGSYELKPEYKKAKEDDAGPS